jgi:hypothetical protein
MNDGAVAGTVPGDAPVRRSPYNRHPLPPAFALALAVFAGLLVALLVLDAITYAYNRIGVGQGVMFALIWLSLLGGLVNIPLARLGGRETMEVGEITVFGIRYRVPVVRRPPSNEASARDRVSSQVTRHGSSSRWKNSSLARCTSV